MEKKMEQVLSPNQAIVKIEAMFAEQMVTGSMDSEPSAFENIKERLSNGSITPSDAVKEAQDLVDSRQNYH